MSYLRTSLECIVADELQRRNISFVEQYPTNSGFVLDFVVSPDTVLEVDGPCHDSSKSRKRDWFRTRCLIMEGWKVHRLNYNLINNQNQLNKKLDEILVNSE